MKADLISYLYNLTDQDQLARIWCDLNGWRWPKDLPDKFKPRWWEPSGPVTYQKSQERKHGVCELIMPFVEKRIPKSLIDQYWQAPRDEDGYVTQNLNP